MAEVGTGTIILLVLWLIAFFFMIFLCSAQSKIKYISIIPLLVASIVTIILALLPRESSTTTTQVIDDTVYSYTSLIWMLMLTGLIITLVASSLIYLASEFIQPKYAKISRPIYYMPQ
jgi:hypothetical protein